MPSPHTVPRRGAPAFLLGALALLVSIGVVMADGHLPVAIEPDAVPSGGAQVATFALG